MVHLVLEPDGRRLIRVLVRQHAHSIPTFVWAVFGALKLQYEVTGIGGGGDYLVVRHKQLDDVFSLRFSETAALKEVDIIGVLRYVFLFFGCCFFL